MIVNDLDGLTVALLLNTSSAIANPTAKVLSTDSTGKVILVNDIANAVAQYGTPYTKEWNSSITTTLSTVVFDISVAGFSTISNIQVTAGNGGTTLQTAPSAIAVIAQSLTSVTVLVLQSNTSGILIGGSTEGLQLDTTNKTIWITIKGT